MSHSPSKPPSLHVLERDLRTIEWLTRLQSITAALASATTTTEVSRIIIEEALPSLSAVIGVVAILRSDGKTLTNLQFQGVNEATRHTLNGMLISPRLPQGS